MTGQKTTRFNTHNLPEWMHPYAQRIVQMLGLGEWEWHFKLVDDPGERRANYGIAQNNMRNLYATIELNRNTEQQDGRDYVLLVLLHEILHVALAPLCLAHTRTIELLPENLRTHAEELRRDAEEQVVERISHAMQEHLEILRYAESE